MQTCTDIYVSSLVKRLSLSYCWCCHGVLGPLRSVCVVCLLRFNYGSLRFHHVTTSSEKKIKQNKI